MNIIGPDELVFGVDDVASCSQYLICLLYTSDAADE